LIEVGKYSIEIFVLVKIRPGQPDPWEFQIGVRGYVYIDLFLTFNLDFWGVSVYNMAK